MMKQINSEDLLFFHLKCINACTAEGMLEYYKETKWTTSSKFTRKCLIVLDP